MPNPTQCPVCKMAVDPQNAPVQHYNDEEYFFCSEHCEEQFLLDPGRYS